jgi:4-hydroxybenzoate polyprenyltransferase
MVMTNLMKNRWWIYQAERFPVLAHGPMVIIFCLSVMLFSSLQANETPAFYAVAGAAISALIFFFQLRVADEFKDLEIDSKYRPHRPVPSGLVRLDELARLAVLGAAIQFLIAVSFDFGLIPILILVWAYIGLMTREFFAPEWLQRRPAIYLVSHMLVMPFIALYVSAFDWLCDCRAIPAGIGWLLLLSFGCGLVLEIGRKIRSPNAEQEGVETYSALWGRGVALSIWGVSVAIAVTAYSKAAGLISESDAFYGLGNGVLLFAMIIVILFGTSNRQESKGKIVESGSGLVAMALYLGLGPIQALLA